MFQATREVARKYGAKIAVVGTSLMIPAISMAQATDTFDASGAVTKIGVVAAGLLLVGGAVFGLNLAIKSTKWARKAL